MSVDPQVQAHPVQLVVTDDLRRSRLTALFRWLLAIPHQIWLSLWGIAALVVAIVSWFAALFTGRVPDGMHSFLARYLRYWTHVTAYQYLVANPFPAFDGAQPYPVDLQLAPNAPQPRLTVAFRCLLAIPPLLLVYVLNIVFYVVGFVAWVCAIFMGTVPVSVRNLLAWCVGFSAQTVAYMFLVTSRYPSFSQNT